MTVMIVLAGVLVLLAAAGMYMAKYSMSIRCQTLEEARAWQETHYDLSWYNMLEKTDYTVSSYDGYVLHAQFLKNPTGREKYIIISHGYTDNRFGALKYASLYLEQGFQVIVYDLRGHGLNERTFCTYTVREREDLAAMIRDSMERYPDAVLLGLHGESLGAATSVAVLEKNPPVDFVVADCGFSNITGVMKKAMKAMHIPAFMVNVASICAKARYGYSYSQMRPIDCLAGNQIPVLFIHGAEDDFITPEHSKQMKEATGGYAEVHLISGAGHAASILTAPETYKNLITAFLAKLF